MAVRTRENANPGRLFLKAAALGYTASVLPPILKILLANRPGNARDLKGVAREVVRNLGEGLAVRGWAVAAGLGLGGAKWGEGMVEPWARKLYWKLQGGRGRSTKELEEDHGGGSELDELDDDRRIKAISTFISSTLASFLAISLLHSSPGFLRSQIAEREALHLPQLSNLTNSPSTANLPVSIPVVSPTLDMTLFMFVRGTDVLVRGLSELAGAQKGRTGRTLNFLASYGDALVFVLSTWRIMWCCESSSWKKSHPSSCH